MNYWERHLGDYYRDAWTLSMLEHGAYGLLMDRYYADEAPIQHAERYEAANARTPTEKAAVDKVLAKFFKRDGDVWRKNRCDEEIDKARRKIEAAKENGKKGGRPKNPTQTQEKPSGLSVGSISETQEKALQTPDTRHQKEGSLRSPSAPSDRDRSPPADSVIGIPLIDGSEFHVTEPQAAEFAELYPAVTITQALRSIRGWCIGNPTRRKTRRGVLKFITAWLEREQNRSTATGAQHDHDRSGSRRESVAERAARLAREGDEREAAREAQDLGDAPPVGANVRDLRPPLDVGFRRIG